MTFTDAANAWVKWANGETSNGEFLLTLETLAFEVRACEAPALTPYQETTIRKWFSAIADATADAAFDRIKPNLAALPT